MADNDFTQDAAGDADITDAAPANGSTEQTEQSDEPMDSSEVNGSGSQAREDERKLFIGGLSWETTDNDLKEYFTKFGEIESVNVKTDPNTGRSRGFAFVIFKAAEGVEQVLAIPEHTIGKKKVEAKKAKARQGKVFVGGLPSDVPEDQIREHFGKFGKIAELEMPFDKLRNQRKGFCFVTYDHEDSVKEILKTPKQEIGGKMVDIKRATPSPWQAPRGAPRGRGGPPMRGGRGGGWGGQQWGGGYGGGGYGGYGGGYGGGYDNYGGGYGGYNDGYGYSGGYGGGGYAAQGQGAPNQRGGPRGRGAGQRFTPY